mmetsp:Transcript_3529/g.6680  ORF Transcript_3529/g.6680 Transcript_3529/m.6680 type:complete len:234 (+) Transcript_3529:3128-3829(+)
MGVFCVLSGVFEFLTRFPRAISPRRVTRPRLRRHHSRRDSNLRIHHTLRPLPGTTDDPSAKESQFAYPPATPEEFLRSLPIPMHGLLRCPSRCELLPHPQRSYRVCSLAPPAGLDARSPGPDPLHDPAPPPRPPRIPPTNRSVRQSATYVSSIPFSHHLPSIVMGTSTSVPSPLAIQFCSRQKQPPTSPTLTDSLRSQYTMSTDAPLKQQSISEKSAKLITNKPNCQNTELGK